MLHNNAAFSIQSIQLFDQGGKPFGGMLNLKGLHDYLLSLPQHGYGTFAVGNIDSYCEHIASSPMRYYNGLQPLPIADSICSLTRVTILALYLHKSNAVQQEGWLTTA